MKCISPIYVRKVLKSVPCGKCAFCLKKAIDAWCLRLAHEMEDSSSAFFITLTYDDVHIPTHHELSKRDATLFIKRLRNRNPGIRYFLVGEYGSKGLRPHYHAVIFNLLNLELITQSWVEEKPTNAPFGYTPPPLGFIKGNRATMGRIRYMVSYMATPPPSDLGDREPPFRLMSRNPGIGHSYVAKNSNGIAGDQTP